MKTIKFKFLTNEFQQIREALQLQDKLKMPVSVSGIREALKTATGSLTEADIRNLQVIMAFWTNNCYKQAMLAADKFPVDSYAVDTWTSRMEWSEKVTETLTEELMHI
ncbi:hypothetical protein UFOVP820_22 [uncultured Caudovirales phage]|uniref:Uncharacterized protein n=1 Tax=uncultured Caudovirales phage TaxID=2100421 RepID=A0A6J5P835_9CAUD|nr:hypothetical protein UFOVP820_22 [uncultured Caudovirales phage]